MARGRSTYGGVSQLYTSPIVVKGTAAAPTEIRAAAFDAAGNFKELQGFYKVPDATTPPPAPANAPDAPTGLTGTGGAHKVTLKWTAGPASVTDYRVVAYDKTGTKVSTTPSTTNSATVDTLTAGEKYTFTVAAHDAAAWSVESAPTDPIQATDSVSISSAKWKAGDFRVIGTGTDAVTPPGTVTLFDAASDQVIGVATAVTPAVAPATGTTFDLRIRGAAAPSVRPAKGVYVKSSLGGRSATVPVA